jgi:hypothetical protein
LHTDTLGVFLDFDENKAAFFMNRERVTKYFKIYSGTTTVFFFFSAGCQSPPPCHLLVAGTDAAL